MWIGYLRRAALESVAQIRLHAPSGDIEALTKIVLAKSKAYEKFPRQFEENVAGAYPAVDTKKGELEWWTTGEVDKRFFWFDNFDGARNTNPAVYTGELYPAPVAWLILEAKRILESENQ